MLWERRQRLDEDDRAETRWDRVERVSRRDGQDGHEGMDIAEVLLEEGFF